MLTAPLGCSERGFLVVSLNKGVRVSPRTPLMEESRSAGRESSSRQEIPVPSLVTPKLRFPTIQGHPPEQAAESPREG